MDMAAVDRIAAMREARLDPPTRQQHRATRPALHDGTGGARFLAGTRGIDHHGLVALLDRKLGRAHERGLAAHADQRRIQRMIGDQPQGAAGAEDVGALVAIEIEGVSPVYVRVAHVVPPRRWRSAAGIKVRLPSTLC
jgi:hypothetical protein